MIGPLGYAVRNLRRRGFHSLLAFLGLTITITSTSFLMLLGQTFASRLGIGFSTSVSFGLGWLVTGYLELSIAFVLIVGLLSASYLVSSMVNQRLRDIGVVKAAGALPYRLFSYAFTEALLVFASSCITGGLVAGVTYAAWSGSLQFDSIRTLIALGVPAVSFALSYLAARRRMLRIIGSNALTIVSSQFSGVDLRSIGKPVRAGRLGSSFNLASRTLSRDRQFLRTVVRVSVCIFLTMVVLSGALVSWDTSKSYLDRAMPSDVIIIGSGQMVSQYSLLARSYRDPVPVPRLYYLNSSLLMSPQLVESFRKIPGVQGVDARLLDYDNVTGYVKAHFAGSGDLSGETSSPEIIPQEYTGAAAVLIGGVTNQTIPDWVTSNGFLQNTDSNFTMVAGDSLLGNLVREPFNLSRIDWIGRPFDVKSALVDPLNAGRVLYAPIQTLQNIFGTTGTKILLVRTDGSPRALSGVQQLATQNGLAFASQESLLSANLSYVDSVWSYLLLLPVLTFVLTCGVLLSYLTTGYSKRFNDYVTLKVLGAGSRYRLGLLLWEGLGIVGPCLLIGLPTALVFSVLFLVPNETVQPSTLGLAAAASTIAMVGVGLVSALIYARRLRMMTVKDLR